MGLTGVLVPAGAELPNGGAARVRMLGWVAAVTAGLCAAGLGFLTASNQAPGLPSEVPWPLLFGAILATPALIGGLGAVSGRRSLLVAAGILCLIQSILAFSGVTLIFLAPALLFLRAAASRRGAPRVGLADAVIGIAVVGLVIGALFSAFANTQTICWNARETPAGIVYERVPATSEFGPIGLETGIVSSGCAGGQPTIQGAALTGILLIGAIAIATQAARTAPSAGRA